MQPTKVPLIELHDAVVRREGKEILRIGDFALGQGENIALIGPNGAGKSTFIHLITREAFPFIATFRRCCSRAKRLLRWRK